MTWNIHGGVGSDRRCDLRRIVELVRRVRPDVVALQEIDSRRAAAQGAFEYLAGSLDMHAAESRLIEAPDGEYGHVLLSRWPLAAHACHDLSVAGREPRAAIEATVESPAGPVRFIAVHLGLSLGERAHQAQVLTSLARSGRHDTVLLGDLNDWRGSVQRRLATVLPSSTTHRTWPAFRPLLALDRIFCRPATLLGASRVETGARRASDHLPLVAELNCAG